MDGEREFAATIALEIDRVFMAGTALTRDHGGRELVRSHGGPSAVGSLIEFRTSLAWPGRVVTWPGLAAVTRYRDPAQTRALLTENAEHGLLSIDDTGFRATDRGHAFLADLSEQRGAALDKAWGAVDDLAALAGSVLAAAAPTAGAAFAAMAPPFERPSAPSALLLVDRIGTLRYHRADAHAAAWAAAGLTAAGIQALPPGSPARVEVEAATNVLAASAFKILSGDERSTLVSGLRALG